jgi:inner membrane protein involved in colicin E2 resistance
VKIGLAVPQRLNPGPWVGKVIASAPISLFLFLFLIFVITSLRKIPLHPMHYFFLSAGFFSFHLLLAYLVDRVPIEPSVVIASVVAVTLDVSYMRLVVDSRFAFVEVGLAMLVYLVLFSCTFFLEGYTGLAITLLCIATLFVVMQATGRLDWEEVFGRGQPSGAA